MPNSNIKFLESKAVMGKHHKMHPESLTNEKPITKQFYITWEMLAAALLKLSHQQSTESCYAGREVSLSFPYFQRPAWPLTAFPPAHERSRANSEIHQSALQAPLGPTWKLLLPPENCPSFKHYFLPKYF